MDGREMGWDGMERGEGEKDGEERERVGGGKERKGQKEGSRTTVRKGRKEEEG